MKKSAKKFGGFKIMLYLCNEEINKVLTTKTNTIMANRISNQLIVTTNTNEELQNFLSAIKGDNIMDGQQQDIDFNKIIPMPLPLRDTEASSAVDDAIYYYAYKTNQLELCKKILRNISFYNMDRFKNKTESEFTEMYQTGEVYVGYYNEFGAKDWYDWSINNWGTKWNAYYTSVTMLSDTTAEIDFDTAWSGVPDIVLKLIEMFPSLKFEYLFADEDMGYNCGEGYSKNGEFYFEMLEPCSVEAMRTYAICKGYEIDDFYQDSDGHWHNREWEDDVE